jgi:hypothetical protein
MRMPRVRFTVRRLMIAVAVVAINLASIMAVRSLWNRTGGGGGLGGGSPTNHWSYEGYLDGSLWVIYRNAITGATNSSRMVRPPTLLGMMIVWWPLATSVCITLATLWIARRPWLSVEPDPPESN